MKILLVDNESHYLNKLKRLLGAKKVINWRKLNKIKANNYDLVVLSGGHLFPVQDHDKDYAAEIKLIKQIKVPLIGICLGSELIAHVFGGKLSRLKHKEHRRLNIKEGKQKVTVYENHRWVLKKLPKHFICLAKSRDGIEMFKHETLSIYGFQFHPEVLVSTTDGKKILLAVLKTFNKKDR